MVSRVALRAFSVVALLLLSLQSTFVARLVECRMSGTVGHCCCHGDEDRVAKAGWDAEQPACDRAPCCTLRSIDTPATPVSVGDAEYSVATPPSVATLVVLPTPRAGSSTSIGVPARSRAPPNGWPPRFIVHRSILS